MDIENAAYPNSSPQKPSLSPGHSLRALSYFEKRMHSLNVSAIPLLAYYAKSKLGMNMNNSITVSPDETFKESKVIRARVK
jgi:hypothetical protein